MMRAARLVVACAALSVTVPTAAQEASGPPAYFFLIESRVGTLDVASWADAVERTAASHAGHAEGNSWAAYRKITGGPDQTLRFFFPLDRMADLDGWRSNREILVDALGKDEGRRVLEDLELDAGSLDRIVAFSKELSRPGAATAASRYLWVASVRVREGKATEYAALTRRLRGAHERHERGLHWLAYTNVVGGEGSEVLYLFPFERYAELDRWPSTREVLAAALGETEGERLAAALGAITETTTSLWHLEPQLSQLDDR